jgi:hypothetical protein
MVVHHRRLARTFCGLRRPVRSKAPGADPPPLGSQAGSRNRLDEGPPSAGGPSSRTRHDQPPPPFRVLPEPVPEGAVAEDVEASALECDRAGPIRCRRPCEVEVSALEREPTPLLGTPGGPSLKVPEPLAKPLRVCERSIEHRFPETGGQRLPGPVDADATPQTLPPSFPGHTDVHDRTVLTLSGGVDARSARSMVDRRSEGHP